MNTHNHEDGGPARVDLSALKAARRREARAQRAEVLPRRDSAARAVANRGLRGAGIEVRAGAVIAGFWPRDDEFNVGPLLSRLSAGGHPIALPVVVAPRAPLIFRQWRAGDRLATGFMDIPAPLPDAPELEPDIVLVPFLQADGSGFRLGYGGGYYDRTLARLRARGPILAIGIGFAGQIVGDVPHDGHDARLDGVLTEDGLINSGAGTTGFPS